MSNASRINLPLTCKDFEVKKIKDLSVARNYVCMLSVIKPQFTLHSGKSNRSKHFRFQQTSGSMSLSNTSRINLPLTCKDFEVKNQRFVRGKKLHMHAILKCKPPPFTLHASKSNRSKHL